MIAKLFKVVLPVMLLAALLVPSVVTRIDRNLVLNQDHPNFGEIDVGPEHAVVWDRRLFLR